jgi:hypothetical protein
MAQSEAPAAEPHGDVDFWRELARARGQVIRALHEFNYWHESTVARGEVIEGLEEAVAQWRERCLAAESRLAAQASRPGSRPSALARRLARAARRVLRGGLVDLRRTPAA